MVDIADKILYRDEWIQGYERHQSNFRVTCTTDAEFEGKTAYFMVANSNREAVTRGTNGLIPASTSDYTRPTATLVEEHDLERGTRYKYFTGQSNQREIAQAQGRNVIHRAVDDRIITQLATGTQTITSATMNKGVVNKAMTTLGNNSVPLDGMNVFGALTPAQYHHLTDLESFSSKDYVDVYPLMAGIPNMQVAPIRMINWMGVNWFPHEGLPGVGTSSSTCFIYSRTSIGYAYADGLINVSIGYDEEQDYYFVRHSIFHAAVVLQGSGIVKVTTDDSGLTI